MARYIRLTSAFKAVQWVLNQINTSINRGCTVEPTIRVSLSEMPVAVAAEASNTALIVVVVFAYHMFGKIEHFLHKLN